MSCCVWYCFRDSAPLVAAPAKACAFAAGAAATTAGAWVGRSSRFASGRITREAARETSSPDSRPEPDRPVPCSEAPRVQAATTERSVIFWLVMKLITGLASSRRLGGPENPVRACSVQHESSGSRKARCPRACEGYGDALRARKLFF
ncbi:hypothetical protein DMH18_03515 [Streptomyces sp. WAC 06783]|nr:hypothetical protein DMH18_03515 [Streptomyces sp. WAC 06783]